MSVFPRLFWFYRVFGCFLAMGVQKHYKKRLTKKIVSKSFNKKFDQKSQTDFFSIFFYHVFGRFSVRGVQQHDKNNRKNKSDPGPFLASDPLTHHGGPRFCFLAAPWGFASFSVLHPLFSGLWFPANMAAAPVSHRTHIWSPSLTQLTGVEASWQRELALPFFLTKKSTTKVIYDSGYRCR
jgi:hypothetical protein